MLSENELRQRRAELLQERERVMVALHRIDGAIAIIDEILPDEAEAVENDDN